MPGDDSSQATRDAPSRCLNRERFLQGWSPDFIPKLTQDAATAKLFAQIVPVNGQNEGIFVGTSSGATLAGALTLAKSAPLGSHIRAMLPAYPHSRRPKVEDRRVAEERPLPAYAQKSFCRTPPLIRTICQYWTLSRGVP
jgi:hypothetical protein